MTDLTVIKGIGEKNAKLYAKLGIKTAESALYYFPRDYISYEEISGPHELCADRIVAFEAEIVRRPTLKRVKRLSVVGADMNCGGIHITSTWFNMPYLPSSLKAGSTYVFRGTLTHEGDHYHIRQPQIFTKEQYEELLGRINPVYPLTKGLTNSSVSKTVKKCFEYLDGSYRQELYDMHFPKDEETLKAARNALVFDEFLIFILRLRLMRDKSEKAKDAFGMIETAEAERVIERLPYRLTGAQLRVWNEIKNDLCSPYSMRRLVQGDVGSGKTILAALAAIMTGMNGYQSAIMAPTEILAEQHYHFIRQLLFDNSIDLNPVLLTGSMSASAKRGVREMIEDGSADIIIGTHALFQEKVVYDRLALVVTDEQHRFGVNQRSSLSSKNTESPANVLVMSATPIPRTLAMIVYGDLDISIIDELPAHKKPIKNAVVNESYRNTAYKFFLKEIMAGHQVYVICPLIEESEGNDAKNVIDTAGELSSCFDNSVSVGILHGRMRPADKLKVMDSFARGDINILVSTTVVEVGVNVPNATVMMIENADRFGLAALHQLRGRIGRGEAQSYCIFMSSSTNPDTMKRLDILKNSNDGFKIAEEDLKTRGPGDMFGIRQSGDVSFRLADIYSDAAILKKASDEASAILSKDPDLSAPEHELLRAEVFESGILSELDSTL
ncbi:MAG: ATP-dependent DNA helicase RecG [Lachnospiraceae bacterium]|nr:ATP-dependent DNA helicase RecG [Lachnospiraceae bacterium]